MSSFLSSLPFQVSIHVIIIVCKADGAVSKNVELGVDKIIGKQQKKKCLVLKGRSEVWLVSN